MVLDAQNETPTSDPGEAVVPLAVSGCVGRIYQLGGCDKQTMLRYPEWHLIRHAPGKERPWPTLPSASCVPLSSVDILW